MGAYNFALNLRTTFSPEKSVRHTHLDINSRSHAKSRKSHALLGYSVYRQQCLIRVNLCFLSLLHARAPQNNYFTENIIISIIILSQKRLLLHLGVTKYAESANFLNI